MPPVKASVQSHWSQTGTGLKKISLQKIIQQGGMQFHPGIDRGQG